jgi:hypothetical protein
MNSICIVDFNGTVCGIPSAFWADYYPDEGIVEFGGDWNDVPIMIVDKEPSQEDIYKFAYDHSDLLKIWRV